MRDGVLDRRAVDEFTLRDSRSRVLEIRLAPTASPPAVRGAEAPRREVGS